MKLSKCTTATQMKKNLSEMECVKNPFLEFYFSNGTYTQLNAHGGMTRTGRAVERGRCIQRSPFI